MIPNRPIAIVVAAAITIRLIPAIFVRFFIANATTRATIYNKHQKISWSWLFPLRHIHAINLIKLRVSMSKPLPKQVIDHKSGKTWNVLQLDENTVKLWNEGVSFLMVIGGLTKKPQIEFSDY